MAKAVKTASPTVPDTARLDRGIETITRGAGSLEPGRATGSPFGPFGFKRILLAVDGSDSARHATAWAKEIALAFKARVLVVAVVPPERVYDTYGVSLGAQAVLTELFTQDVKGALQVVKDATRTLAKAGVAADERILYGTPTREIVKLVIDEKMDLVVLGSHGSNVVERLLLGSVSDGVKNHAPCSVLIARSAPKAERILIPVDGSRASRRAAGIGTRLAHAWKAQATIFHAYFPAVFGPNFPPRVKMPPNVPEAEGLSDAYVKFQMVVGPPAEEIVKMAQQKDCGLIVMGSRGLSGLKSWTTGSISNRVAHTGRTSLLLVKGPTG